MILLATQFQSWIPATLVRSSFNLVHSAYTARFFVSFGTAETVVAAKVIAGNKSPRKFYKVKGSNITSYHSLPSLCLP